MTVIKYPRNQLLRNLLRYLGHLILLLLARPVITGKTNFPAKGPIIVVGNHTGAMEVVLMTIYAPWTIEYMGSVDIPHEKLIYFFIKLYDFIPVFRGNVSKSSMQAGLSILSQNGALGLFPEGGIWEPGIRSAHTGVSWLSSYANVPVLPIGFGSMRGTVNQIFSLKRPTLVMNVGQPLPPVQLDNTTSKKEQLQEAANEIMDAVWELIPEEDKSLEETIADETFSLIVDISTPEGEHIPIPPTLPLNNGAFFSKFIHRATLFSTLRDNLDLPIHILQELHTIPSPDKIIRAAQSILDYLETTNPFYFTYRYGPVEGNAMQAGITEIHNLAQWVSQNDYQLKIITRRIFKDINSGQEIVLDQPQKTKKW